MSNKAKLCQQIPHGRYAMGRSLSILYRFSQRFIDLRLNEYNINHAQMGLMIVLINEADDLNQTGLNEFFGYNKATITKLINRLEKEGYVERKCSSSDKREKIISVTQKGYDIYPIIVEAVTEEEKVLDKMVQKSDTSLPREVLYNMAESAKDYEL